MRLAQDCAANVVEVQALGYCRSCRPLGKHPLGLNPGRTHAKLGVGVGWGMSEQNATEE